MVGSGALATPSARGQPPRPSQGPASHCPFLSTASDSWDPLPALPSPGGAQGNHRPFLTMPHTGALQPHSGHREEEVAAVLPPGQLEAQRPSLYLGAPTGFPMGLSVRLELSGHSYVSACIARAFVCLHVSVRLYLALGVHTQVSGLMCSPVCGWERAEACTPLADFVSPLCGCVNVCATSCMNPIRMCV